METTELAAIDQKKLAELDAKWSDGRQERSSDSISLPFLKIGYDNKDTSTWGKWTITHEGKDLVADKVTFRPLVNTYKYSNFDFTNKEMVCETVEMRKWSDEPIDTKGTLRCGRPLWEHMKNAAGEIDKAQLALWDHVKYENIIRGLVHFDDENKNIPCRLVIKRATIRKFKETYLNKLRGNEHIRDHTIELSTKEQRTGNVDWHEIIMKPNLKEVIPFDQATLDTWVLMNQFIDKRNNEIREKYTEALREKNTDKTSIDALKDALDEETDE